MGERRGEGGGGKKWWHTTGTPRPINWQGDRLHNRMESVGGLGRSSGVGNPLRDRGRFSTQPLLGSDRVVILKEPIRQMIGGSLHLI